jgi:hypothetical protein
MGSDYWKGLVDWIKTVLINTELISQDDMNLFHVTDDPIEAVKIIADFYQKRAMTTNF